MFSIFTLLIALLAVLPLNGFNPADLSKSDNFSPVAELKTPSILSPSIAPAAKDNNPPGQEIKLIAHEDHPGGISDQVHQIIEEHKNAPTPTSTPVSSLTITPNPEPVDIEPSIYPKPTGCSPCGGDNSGGKYQCIMMMPCMY